MATVVFDHVSKTFATEVALVDMDLRVADGEFLVLLGPSGSGKTTALRILAGLETLSSGHVMIDDQIVDAMPPRARDIAMVFQDYALYPQMSVYDNLAFGLKVARVPRSEIRQRVADTAAALELQDLLKRKPRELSGGQRQRVALGRALAREPKVFLMDEPLSNLDAKLRTQTRGEIKRLQMATGKTTLYVTHDQVEAMTMGDRIAVMHDGQLAQVGKPSIIYESPANSFVASFVGSPSMSIIACELTSEEGTPYLRHGQLRIRCNNTSGLGGEVLLGVRPEHAVPWNGDAALFGPLRGRVENVEALGRETFVTVEVSDGVRLGVELAGVAGVELGGSLDFGLRPGKLYLFDPDTGATLGRI